MMIPILLAALAQSYVPPKGAQPENPTAPVLAPCDLGADVRMAPRLSELPSEIAEELQRFFGRAGGIAEVGDPYNATDVLYSGVPMRRFLRAYHVRKRWIVWYEHGGMAAGPRTLVLTRGWPPNVDAYSAQPATTLAGDLCMASKALVGGVRASTP